MVVLVGEIPIPDCNSFVNPVLRSACLNHSVEELVWADLRYVLCSIAGKEVAYAFGDVVKRGRLCDLILRYTKIERSGGVIRVLFNDEGWKGLERGGLRIKVKDAIKALKKAIRHLKKHYS